MGTKVDLKKHTTSFGGNPYVMVSGKVLLAHEDNAEALSIQTEVVHRDEDGLTVKATVTTRKGTFTGHATSYLKSGTPQERKTPLEVAETSAVGRALAFAGYATEHGIASAEEMERVQNGHSAPVARPATDGQVFPSPSRMVERYNSAVVKAQRIGEAKIGELRAAWTEIVGKRKGSFEEFSPAMQSRIVETFEGLLVGALPEEEEADAS